MKVMYIGVYRDGGGWCQAATDYILAMDTVGIDVVPRPMKLSPLHYQPPKRIIELEEKDTKNVDVVIQHTLPNFFAYNGNFKNIGLFALETENIALPGWIEKINTLDELWVIYHSQKRICEEAGVRIPIKVVPHAVDVAKFQSSHEKLDIPPLRDKFVFYTVGEFNRRKNFAALIRAFNLEFMPHEPVELMIKTSIPGLSAEDSNKEVQRFNAEVKRGLKIYPNIETYKSEILISQRLDDEQMMAMHEAGDCFITPSHGEAWCIPAMDALGVGNPVICPKIGGMVDFVNKDNGWLCDTFPISCFGVLDTLPHLHTGLEYWSEVNEFQLRAAMREAYSNKSLYHQKSIKAMETPYSFSYEKVGLLIKDNLE